MSKNSSATYTQDELMSATQVARNFGGVLNSLLKNGQKKIGVLRKNKLDAVILSAEEYERMQGIVSEREFYEEVSRRMKTPREEFIPMEDVLRKSPHFT